MAPQSYDMIVIGAGPGGYVAAIRAALDAEDLAKAQQLSDAMMQLADGNTDAEVPNQTSRGKSTLP